MKQVQYFVWLRVLKVVENASGMIFVCVSTVPNTIYIYIDYKTAAVFQAVKLKLLKGVHLSE